MSCHHCEGIRHEFDEGVAGRELRRFRRRGPRKSTRLLLDALSRLGLRDATLLDIGGGVGVIHHVLLDDGIGRAIHVNASPAYLTAASGEASRRGHADRVEFLEGDFVELADRLAPVAVVTLDRVICCYPDMATLVARSAGLAQQVYGVVYPRDTWLNRVWIPLANVFFRLRRTGFRVFLHPPSEIETTIRSVGLERVSLLRTVLWEVGVYSRRHREASEGPPPRHGGPSLRSG